MLELGGIFGLFLFGLLLALFTPEPRAKSERVADGPQDSFDAQETDRAELENVGQNARDDTAEILFRGAVSDASDHSRIRNFEQGTDVLELHYAPTLGPLDLKLDPNRTGGTDVVLNGELVAVVDNVMLMGADVVVRPKMDQLSA